MDKDELVTRVRALRDAEGIGMFSAKKRVIKEDRLARLDRILSNLHPVRSAELYKVVELLTEIVNDDAL